MILDSSAIVALFMREPEAAAFAEAVGRAPSLAVSSVSLVQTSIVLSHRMGLDARPTLQVFLRRHGVEVIPFTETHWHSAADAWWRFGKGRHEARLNFGDCAAYATAKVAGLPLLFKGEDFGRTDVLVARW